MAILSIVVLAGCINGCGRRSETSQIMVLSDVHFNPFYDAAIFQSLANSDASQWKDIFESSTNTTLSTWGEDTNYPLLRKALASVKANSTSSSIAIFPGDMLVHGFETKFYLLYGSEDETAMRAFLLKTVTFFATEVRANLGNIPVVFELGNNDAYEGDYKIEPNSPFLTDTAEPFYTLFLNSTADHETFFSTYQTGGYYLAQPLGTNFAIIGLNSIFFSPDAASDTQAAATAELDWFESTLAAAASSGQKVWILTHIPTGANIHSNMGRIDSNGQLGDAKMLWDPTFQERFLSILSTYSETVTMVFTGHTHMDEYRLPIGSLEVTPAISPIDGNNPAFKIFNYYKNSFKVSDYKVMNYDLATAPDSFENYYTFSSVYETLGISGTLDVVLETIFPFLATDASKQASYKNYYYSGHNDSNPITDLNWPVYWCGIGMMVKEDYTNCVNNY